MSHRLVSAILLALALIVTPAFAQVSAAQLSTPAPGDAPQVTSNKVEALTPDDLKPILEHKGEVEFVLLGTGAVQALPPKAIREALRDARVGLEFMDTPAAARLYNVLASEGRRLAAALIAI